MQWRKKATIDSGCSEPRKRVAQGRFKHAALTYAYAFRLPLGYERALGSVKKRRFQLGPGIKLLMILLGTYV